MASRRFGVPFRYHPWAFAVVAGALSGLVILGVGGRVAMRLIGVQNGQPGAWTVGGTMTVIFMGVVSGVGGAAIRAAASAWLPPRLRDSVGTAVFAIACLLLTLRGLKPVDAQRLAFFLPLTIAYVVVFEVLWRRRPRTAGDAATDPAPSPRASPT